MSLKYPTEETQNKLMSLIKEVGGVGPKYMELMFHQRQREGDLYQRHPGIEQALEEFRKTYPAGETEPQNVHLTPI